MQHPAQSIEAAPYCVTESSKKVHGCRQSCPGAMASDFFLDTRSLAGALPQIVQLRAPHAAAALDRDGGDARAVGLESALDALAVRDLAHGEGGVEAAVATGDDYTLVGLNPLAISLDHLDLHHHGIAGLEIRHRAGHALSFERLDNVTHCRFLVSRALWRSNKNSSNNCRCCASSGVRPISSGRVSQVRPSACWARQRPIAA